MASIRKRKWGDDREGWVIDYVDQKGKRHLKTFSTKKEAEAWKVTALHEVKQGTHTPASQSIIVNEAGVLWIAHCEAEGLEYGTVLQRRQHLNLHIGPFIGREKLSSLTTPGINDLLDKLRDGGRSLSMRQKVLTNLKTLLNFCQSRGLVAQNVALGVRIKKDRSSKKKPLREGVDYPSRAEIRTLIDARAG